MPAKPQVHRLLPTMPTASVGATVSRRLSEAIQLGLLQPGEQLPSEADLARQLGVSTVSLREALAMLREQGLVETRRGRTGGTFVCEPSESSTARLRLVLLQRSAIDLRDLGDEWAAIAGATARLAAARASAAHVKRLGSLAAELAQANSVGDRSRAHSLFFVELALASQSERLTRAEVRLQAELGEILWLAVEPGFDAHAAAGSLTEIATSVEHEAPAAACQIAQQHVLTATRWLISTRIAAQETPR